MVYKVSLLCLNYIIINLIFCCYAETCTELEDRNTTHFWYVSNMEGTSPTVFCLEGYVLSDGSGQTQFEFKCTSDGAWSPDPDDYHCVQGIYIHVHAIYPYDIYIAIFLIHNILSLIQQRAGSSSSNTGLSSGEMVALVVVMVVVVSICIGIVVFIVIVCRRKSPSETLTVY